MQTAPDQRFTHLNCPRRVWAIPAIHADCARLQALHDRLYPRICPGDRIVYLGNYTGHGPYPRQTVDEILIFRRMVLALPGMIPEDIVYLRGVQEEMWHHLMQTHFAPSPAHALKSIVDNGLACTLEGYGIRVQDGIGAAQEGVMALVRWTGKIREIVRRQPGHDIFARQQKRAAYTGDNALLFVHTGLDPGRPLAAQDEQSWNACHSFHNDSRYAPFAKVIRGFDPDHMGMRINDNMATLDHGCGFGGPLVCVGFGNNADIFDLIEV